MSAPQVSVLMAVRDGADHLQAAVQSILEQTLRDLELVVVDDGSSDASWEILQELARQDDRVVLLRNTKPQGLPSALNFAAAKAAAPLLARQDADDVCAPQRLERQCALLALRPEISVLGARHALMDLLGEIVSPCAPVADSLAQALRERGCIFAHGSAVLRAGALAAVGGYDPRFFHTQDLDLWCRMQAQGLTLARLEEPLYTLRLGPAPQHGAKSRNQQRMTGLLRARHLDGQDINSDLTALAASPSPHSPADLSRQAEGSYWLGMARLCAENGLRRRAVSCLKRALALGCAPGPRQAAGLFLHWARPHASAQSPMSGLRVLS